MFPEIPEVARTAAQTFLRSFDRATELRGEAYFAKGAVKGIEPLDEGIAFYAAVSGTHLYDVVVDFDEQAKKWECQCDCPVEARCKHIFAVMKSLLVNGASASGETPQKSAPTPKGLLAQELAIRHVRQSVFHAGNAHQPLGLRIVGRDLLVADRPAAEIEGSEAQAVPGPAERA